MAPQRYHHPRGPTPAGALSAAALRRTFRSHCPPAALSFRSARLKLLWRRRSAIWLRAPGAAPNSNSSSRIRGLHFFRSVGAKSLRSANAVHHCQREQRRLPMRPPRHMVIFRPITATATAAPESDETAEGRQRTRVAVALRLPCRVRAAAVGRRKAVIAIPPSLSATSKSRRRVEMLALRPTPPRPMEAAAHSPPATNAARTCLVTLTVPLLEGLGGLAHSSQPLPLSPRRRLMPHRLPMRTRATEEEAGGC